VGIRGQNAGTTRAISSAEGAIYPLSRDVFLRQERAAQVDQIIEAVAANDFDDGAA